MDAVQVATDLITNNQATAVGLVVALFGLTLVPRLAVIAVKRAGQGIVSVAKGDDGERWGHGPNGSWRNGGQKADGTYRSAYKYRR